ncbi:MAG TPA: hypothetical protein VH593_25290 [Ktedonobacteraceae bacterium]|jgi:hypothetical protein
MQMWDMQGTTGLLIADGVGEEHFAAQLHWARTVCPVGECYRATLAHENRTQRSEC